MIDANAYKNVMGSFPSGVTVITTLDDDGQVVGLTASAFSSLSMDPALVLFCPNYSSDSYPTLIKNKRFAIHFLSGTQQSEAYAFARKGKDKAARHRVDIERTGQPAAGQRDRDHRVRAVARIRRWRPRDHGRRGKKPDPARADPPDRWCIAAARWGALLSRFRLIRTKYYGKQKTQDDSANKKKPR
jgi:hypothetical protein